MESKKNFLIFFVFNFLILFQTKASTQSIELDATFHNSYTKSDYIEQSLIYNTPLHPRISLKLGLDLQQKNIDLDQFKLHDGC